MAYDEHTGEVQGIAAEKDGNEMLKALETVRDHLGWWPWLRRNVLAAGFPRGQIEDVNEVYWKMLSTTRPHRFNEIEYHLPIETGLKAFREVARILESNPANYYPVEIRRTAPDDAWLSPFNDAERMSIAVHAAHREEHGYFFTEIEPVFRIHGGRPHWGKLHSLGYEELRTLYPQFNEFNELRRDLDPEGKMLNPHLAKIFGETAHA
ncbi:D-arabinono-1,4-lactone oxidase [Ruegeria sp. HKCCD8929]|uniref:D-arabinono-1,4-lactone oxidase n=1 Tax=Ruegeria sp. HKCCD8929 TaxID=2683006 RepID=UPI0035302AB3